jgi:FAD/FMN-containing dehydrogenase
MKIQWQTYWTEDQDDYLYLEWINSVYTEFFKNSGGTPDPEKDPTDSVEGCYYNYPDVDLNGPDNDKEPALKLYFGTNLPRLKGVKHRWDPNNYFNSLQSI